MKNKIKGDIIWIANILILAVIVFLGIEQGGFGAEVSKLDKMVEKEITLKRTISDNIFKNQEIKDQNKITELGFNKPSTILYFDTEEAIAKLPVQ